MFQYILQIKLRKWNDKLWIKRGTFGPLHMTGAAACETRLIYVRLTVQQ